jgi:hypothetical protein
VATENKSLSLGGTASFIGLYYAFWELMFDHAIISCDFSHL